MCIFLNCRRKIMKDAMPEDAMSEDAMSEDAMSEGDTGMSIYLILNAMSIYLILNAECKLL